MLIPTLEKKMSLLKLTQCVSIQSLLDVSSYLTLRLAALNLISDVDENLEIRKSIISKRLLALNRFKSHCFHAVESHVADGNSFHDEVFATIDFTTTKQRPDKTWGRLYPFISGSSYQTLSRDLRFCLLEDFNYIDCDIINSHPSILLSYCHDMSIIDLIPHFTLYASDRVKFFSQISPEYSKDYLKKVFIKQINSNFQRTHEDKVINFLLTQIYKEMCLIRHYLQKNPLFLEIYDSLPSASKKRLVTAQTLFLGTKEKEIICNLIDFLEKKVFFDDKLACVTPLHDGLFFHKKGFDIEKMGALLQEFEISILKTKFIHFTYAKLECVDSLAINQHFFKEFKKLKPKLDLATKNLITEPIFCERLESLQVSKDESNFQTIEELDYEVSLLHSQILILGAECVFSASFLEHLKGI